ncbi:MAG: DUF167 domain-containing protein [Actinomycetota bacterium]
MARFDVYVVPRSSRTGPDGRYGGLPRLRVKAPATDGRANAEAARRLRALLGAPVGLKSGGRARRKTFEADLAGRVFEAKLRAAFGD